MHTAPSREAAGAVPASPEPQGSSTPAPTGLRERNRVRRTRRVERAALELALEHGLEGTTVDAICEASDVSPRTFFNYFGSKESALLGAPPAPLTDAQVEVFLAGDGTVLEDLMTLLATTFLASDPDMELWRMRRELFAREPLLHAAQLTRVADKKERVAATVATRLRAADPALSEESALEEGHLTHGIAMSAFQQLGREWTAVDTATPDIAALVDAAMSRVRRIVCPRA